MSGSLSAVSGATQNTSELVFLGIDSRNTAFQWERTIPMAENCDGYTGLFIKLIPLSIILLSSGKEREGSTAHFRSVGSKPGSQLLRAAK